MSSCGTWSQVLYHVNGLIGWMGRRQGTGGVTPALGGRRGLTGAWHYENPNIPTSMHLPSLCMKRIVSALFSTFFIVSNLFQVL